MKKSIILLIGVLFLAAGSGMAKAEMSPLSNDQLDAIAAGTITSTLDDSARSYGSDQEQELENTEIENDVDDVNALNVVNLVDTTVDNSSDESVNVLSLRDDVQKEARAIMISNTIGGKIASGINVNVGGLEREFSSSGTGFVPSLNQSNIIIQ